MGERLRVDYSALEKGAAAARDAAHAVRDAAAAIPTADVEVPLPGSATAAAWTPASRRWAEVLGIEAKQLEVFAAGVTAAASTYAQRDRQLTASFAVPADQA